MFEERDPFLPAPPSLGLLMDIINGTASLPRNIQDQGSELQGIVTQILEFDYAEEQKRNKSLTFSGDIHEHGEDEKFIYANVHLSSGRSKNSYNLNFTRVDSNNRMWSCWYQFSKDVPEFTFTSDAGLDNYVLAVSPQNEYGLLGQLRNVLDEHPNERLARLYHGSGLDYLDELISHNKHTSRIESRDLLNPTYVDGRWEGVRDAWELLAEDVIPVEEYLDRAAFIIKAFEFSEPSRITNLRGQGYTFISFRVSDMRFTGHLNEPVADYAQRLRENQTEK